MKLLIVATEYAIGMLPFGSSLFNILSRAPGMEVYGIFLSKGNRNYRRLVDTNLHENAVFIENDYNKVANLANKFLPLHLYRTICDMAQKHGIEHIHFVTGDFSMGYLIKRLRRKYTIFYTAHDITPHAYGKIPFKDRFFNKIIRRGVLKMLKYAHHITTCSQYQVNQLSSQYNIPAQLTHFPSLVSPEMEHGDKLCPEVENIGKYILFFGGITQYKGVELLYDAFTQSPSLCNNYKLVITGRGTLNRPPHPSVIRVARFIDDNEVKHLFTQAACAVYPYLSATMSGVLSVAYFYGTPLVLSDINFFKENASETAHLFATGSVESLQQALTEVLNITSEKREKEIASNKAFYNETYAHEKVCSNYMQFYEQALRKHIVIVRGSGNIIDYNSYNCQEIGLAKALVKHGLKVSVVMAGHEQSHHRIYNDLNQPVDVYYLKRYGINQALTHFVGLYSLLDTLRPDIIQAHDVGQLVTYSVAQYAAQRHIPSTLIQGTYQETQKPIFKQLEQLYNHTLGKITLQKIDVVGCKTNMAAKYIASLCHKETLPTRIGLDTTRLQEDSTPNNTTLAQMDGCKVLLYIGALEKRRNPLFLIDIIASLPQDYRLVVVGTGPLLEETRKLAQQKAPGKVIFTGRIGQNQVAQLYRKAHLFLLPTSYEIYGMVILESMYFGVPVITTSNAGSLTLIDNQRDGVIIPNLRVEEWTTHITRLCNNDSLRNEMQQNAARKISQNYTWDAVALQYIDAYNVAMNSKKRKRE